MNDKRDADRRVIRTHRLLREALIELLKEMPIGKITPTELCRRADINRNTFYSHYTSPLELLSSLENELFDEVEKAVMHCSEALEIISATCLALRKNRDICSVLFTNNADPAFSARIFSIAHQRNMDLIDVHHTQLNANYRQMMSAFSINGCAAVLQIWIQNGMVEKPEDIAKFMQSLSWHGTRAFGPY